MMNDVARIRNGLNIQRLNNNNNNNNNNNLICIAPVCAKRLQWRWENEEENVKHDTGQRRTHQLVSFTV